MTTAVLVITTLPHWVNLECVKNKTKLKMQHQGIWLIRNLLSLRTLALQLPKYSKMVTSNARIEQQSRNFAVHSSLTQAATTKAEEQKTKKLQQKITLIGQNQTMSITTLEEAQKLAKRRDLHLLRLNQTDAKTGRIVYKLVHCVGNRLTNGTLLINYFFIPQIGDCCRNVGRRSGKQSCIDRQG